MKIIKIICISLSGILLSSCNACNNETKMLKFEKGATEQNLAWAENADMEVQLARIQAMADAGAKWIRLTLRTPFAPLIEHIRKANDCGIKVLVHLSSSVPYLYLPNATKRPGNNGKGGVAWDSYALSDLNLPFCQRYIRDFLLLVKKENITVTALEMFNEINWNAFNGDLPLISGGMFIDENTPWDNPIYEKYRKGIEKVGKVTEVVSKLNDEIFNGSIDVISCGQVGAFEYWKSSARNAVWMAKAQGVLVSHALTLRLLEGSLPMQENAENYLKYADGIGIHIYPQVTEEDPDIAVKEINTIVKLHMDSCLGIDETGKEKPFWITECGFRRSTFKNDEQRLTQFKRFMKVLDKYDRTSGRIGTVLIYNFGPNGDEAADYALWDEGELLPAGGIFK